MPSKPQAVLVERWLPYAQPKRRVVFQPNTQPDPVVVKPKNVVVQWEAPEAVVKKKYKFLGETRADPAAYVKKYGRKLVKSSALPELVTELPTEEGYTLAAQFTNDDLYELEGDVQALKLVDLDAEGLADYRSFVAGLVSRASGRFSELSKVASRVSSQQSSAAASLRATSAAASSRATSAAASSVVASRTASASASRQATALSARPASAAASRAASAAPAASRAASQALSATAAAASRAASVAPAASRAASQAQSAAAAVSRATSVVPAASRPSSATIASIDSLVEQIFVSLDSNQDGLISVEDAGRVLLRLNSRLGRSYGEDDVNAFFNALDVNHDGTLTYDEFRQAFFTVTV